MPTAQEAEQHQLSLALPMPLVRWLDRRAATTGNSRSAEIRHLIAEAMRQEAEQCSG